MAGGGGGGRRSHVGASWRRAGDEIAVHGGVAYYLCLAAGWPGEQCNGGQESQSGAARKSKAVQGAGACLDASSGSTGLLVAVTSVDWPVERVTAVRLTRLWGGGGLVAFGRIKLDGRDDPNLGG